MGGGGNGGGGFTGDFEPVFAAGFEFAFGGSTGGRSLLLMAKTEVYGIGIRDNTFTWSNAVPFLDRFSLFFREALSVFFGCISLARLD
jgi:hypothetical protein